jgi:hypothetical protein
MKIAVTHDLMELPTCHGQVTRKACRSLTCTFVPEQANAVPTFVADALRKQMANKHIDMPKQEDKENHANCNSLPAPAVEISMEATKATLTLTPTASTPRRRRATVSGGPLHQA